MYLQRNTQIKIIYIIILQILGSYIIYKLNFFYLALSYIIVYIGAISLLFIFILMMLDDNNIIKRDENRLKYQILLIITYIMLNQITLDINNYYEYINQNWYKNYNNITDINNYTLILFNGSWIYIYLLGLIIWVLLIGILAFI